MMRNLLRLIGFVLFLTAGFQHTTTAQDSTALIQQNQRLQQAQDSLVTMIEHYQTINEKYYELAKESRSVTTWIWSIVGLGSIIALLITLWRVYIRLSLTWLSVFCDFEVP